MQRLKAGTRRVLLAEFQEFDEFLRDDQSCTDGYFAKTVRVVEEDVDRKYI